MILMDIIKTIRKNLFVSIISENSFLEFSFHKYYISAMQFSKVYFFNVN